MAAVTLLPLNKKLGTVLHHYTIREVLLVPQLPAGVVLPMMAVLPATATKLSNQAKIRMMVQVATAIPRDRKTNKDIR